MDTTPLTSKTLLSQYPSIINTNFQNVEDFIHIFYDEDRKILIKPVETTGRIKGDTGQFVNVITDNLTVKQQYTNLYDNISTADLSYLKMLNGDAVLLRDPCTYGIDTSTWNFPYEPSAYKVLDVGGPYYKITNEYPIYLNNNNLSQVVGLYLDPSLVGNNPFEILLDYQSGLTYSIDTSLAGSLYFELIAYEFDASYGSKWDHYKIGGSGAGSTSGSLIADGLTYENPNLTTSSAGGIEISSSFFNTEKTFSDVMQAMFYPALDPALSPPSSGFSFTATESLYEIGESITLSFTSSFNRGSINPAYTTSGFRSGLPNTYLYSGPSLPSSVASNNLTNTQVLNPYEIVQGTQTWNNAVSYDAGEQPVDSEGNNYDSPLPAGTTSTNSVSFEGVYPLFGTTSSITDPDTKQSLVSMVYGNNVELTLVPQPDGLATGNYQSFDIPIAWTISRPLLGIQTFDPVSGSWKYEGGTTSTSLAKWNTSSTTHNIQGNTINYTRYTYNGTDRSSVQIRLIF